MNNVYVQFYFFFIYSQQMQKDKGEPFSRWNGRLIVSIALVIHVFFIYTLIRAIIFYASDKTNFININGGITYPLILIAFVLPNFYYNKNKAEAILSAHQNYLLEMNLKNSLKILSLLLIPLIILIRLSIRSIYGLH